MGSNNFLNTVKSYFSYSNVDSVVGSCNLLVQSDVQYRYCCEKNKVKYYLNGTKTEGDFSCSELLNMSLSNNLLEISCSGVSC